MEHYSFEQLPRAVSELHQKLDNIQDFLLGLRQPTLIVKFVTEKSLSAKKEKGFISINPNWKSGLSREERKR